MPVVSGLIVSKLNIDELKQLIKNSTSVVVMENGEPSFVVLEYGVYKELVLGGTSEKEIRVRNTVTEKKEDPFFYNGSHDPIHQSVHNRDREAEILERLNKDILALKAQIESEERGLSSRSVDSRHDLD